MLESFKSEEEYFEADAIFDGRPLKRLQKTSNVFMGPGLSEEVCSKIMKHLVGDTIEERIAIVKTGGDEGVDVGFSLSGSRSVGFWRCNRGGSRRF